MRSIDEALVNCNCRAVETKLLSAVGRVCVTDSGCHVDRHWYRQRHREEEWVHTLSTEPRFCSQAGAELLLRIISLLNFLLTLQV